MIKQVTLLKVNQYICAGFLFLYNEEKTDHTGFVKKENIKGVALNK